MGKQGKYGVKEGSSGRSLKGLCSALALVCVVGGMPHGAMAARDAMGDDITQAQPPLPTVPLTITGQDGQAHHFTVELARTPREQEVGEMFRKHIPADQGMLFIWPAPQDCAMWMRNTFVSLDIVFIDEENRIHAMEEHTVPLSEGIISSHGPVRSVLELPAGTAERLGLVVGDQVSTTALADRSH